METLIRFYKVARWFILAAAVVVMYLVLRVPPIPPAPPAEEHSALAAEFETKISAIEQAHADGNSGAVARFTGKEINAVLARSVNSEALAAAAAAASDGESAPPPVKDWRVAFEGDVATAYVTTERFGKDILVTVSGRLGAQDGYATFEPTAFKIGDLSVPVSMVEPALQKKLAEPETRERLRLPAFISSMKVEDSQLVITEQAE